MKLRDKKELLFTSLAFCIASLACVVVVLNALHVNADISAIDIEIASILAKEKIFEEKIFDVDSENIVSAEMSGIEAPWSCEEIRTLSEENDNYVLLLSLEGGVGRYNFILDDERVLWVREFPFADCDEEVNWASVEVGQRDFDELTDLACAAVKTSERRVIWRRGWHSFLYYDSELVSSMHGGDFKPLINKLAELAGVQVGLK